MNTRTSIPKKQHDTAVNLKSARVTNLSSAVTSRMKPLRPVAKQAVILNANGMSSVRGRRTRALRKAGYRVIDASDCSEALRVGIERQLDIIVLNGLSGPEGLRVCAKLRANPTIREVPLIALCSSHTRNYAHYPDSCFLEPVKPTTLVSIVGLALRVKAAERRLEQNQRLEITAKTGVHDLLSPLCTISSLAAWIREEYADQLGGDGRGYLGLLEQSVDRMRAVIVRTFENSI